MVDQAEKPQMPIRHEWVIVSGGLVAQLTLLQCPEALCVSTLLRHRK